MFFLMQYQDAAREWSKRNSASGCRFLKAFVVFAGTLGLEHGSGKGMKTTVGTEWKERD